MSELQLVLKAEILGADVDAVFAKKTGEAKKYNVQKSAEDTTKMDVECLEGTTTLLVHGKPETPQEYDIMRLFQELTTLLTLGNVKKDSVTNLLPEKVQSVMEQVRFSLRQVYLVKNGIDVSLKNKSDTAQKTAFDYAITNDKSSIFKAIEKANKQTSKEYSLWIDINVDESLLKGFPVKVKSASFKVWSTQNPDILKEMEIDKMKKLLEQAQANIEA